MSKKLTPAQQRVVDLLKMYKEGYIQEPNYFDPPYFYCKEFYGKIRYATLNALIRLGLLTEFEKGKWRLK
tara:strand:- start:770 stop:979 length:210 start_codon:yes stop_codon:yes gene_type:complete